MKRVIALIIYVSSLIILGLVDIKIPLGIILFNWGMNIENSSKD